MPNKLAIVHHKNGDLTLEYILDNGTRVGVVKLPQDVKLLDVLRLIQHYTNPHTAQITVLVA